MFATDAATDIINNVAFGPLVAVTESTLGNIDISGIRFEHAQGLSLTESSHSAFIELSYAAGGQPVFIHDDFFLGYTYGDQIKSHTNRGVIWNDSFVSLPFSQAPIAIHLPAPSLSTSWTSPSTMGTNDTTGTSNLYVEDVDFHGWLNATDFDDNARSVIRHSLFDNAGFGVHGPDSSSFGQRHFEVYDSEFHRSDFSDGQTLNVNWWFLIRGGTAVITDNIMPAFGGSDYGGKTGIVLAVWNLQFNGGPNPLWGANIAGVQFPVPRQIGRGYVNGTGLDGEGRNKDSITFVGDSEPIYIWNNTGAYTIGASQYSTPLAGQDVVADYVVAGRDYITSAKPGYTKFPYPHPLRSGTSVILPPPPVINPDTSSPSVPTNLVASAVSSSQINLTWSPSTDNTGVTGYKVYRNGIQIASPLTSSYSNTGLTASTQYTYTVSAYDAAGNTSAQSSSVSATTQATPVVTNKFIIGDRVHTTSNLKVRSTANGTLLGTQKKGSYGTVTAGPVTSGNYVWWNVNFDAGVDGWSAENWLSK
jgi:chitodextrinase